MGYFVKFGGELPLAPSIFSLGARTSAVAGAFKTHPEDQYEEENEV